ncbi:GCN5-related N-acetyltransferase [Candidatus Koribacter versatilis Ellin345]|uniref:GCN5-related N-acetyltransferase n=2 Tax=Candidatus Korobacter versatilis TaxID=658062 RepID=Q1IP16_KORVE|nr:GCN5-related N-acetyltransferase [Candidatus Koribacter versatilis Ellin345]
MTAERCTTRGKIRHTMGMNFRELNPSDAAAYWNVRLEALETEREAFGKAPEEFRVLSVEDMATRLRDMSDGSFCMGGFDGEALIGIATFIRETRVKEQHKAHIYGVYVKASHRGRGVGRALMQQVLDRARPQAGLDHILLAVATTNTTAFELYRSLGFETWGTEPHALRVGDKFVDEHQMVLRLR